MSRQRRYTTLDTKQIATDYPNGFNAFVSWLQSMDDDIKEQEVKQISDFSLRYNTRVLFDFFDDCKLRVSIIPIMSDDESFTYSISDGASHYAENRNEAEEKAFLEGFKILENDHNKRSET